MADHPLVDGSDQGQRGERCLSGAQRVDERGNPLAVSECPSVNLPHGLVIFWPFRPDSRLDTSDLKVVP